MTTTATRSALSVTLSTKRRLTHFVVVWRQNLCLEKAEKLGVKTARLPIGTYLSALPTRKVLTVNQVSSSAFPFFLLYSSVADSFARFARSTRSSPAGSSFATGRRSSAE